MNIEVYTDGSATVKTKPGGYGWVIVLDGVQHSEGSGHMERASNNDAELEAAIQGLVAAYKLINTINPPWGKTITLISDSEIILGWASGRYRFKQQDKIDKYKALQHLMNKLEAKTKWVQGHSGDVFNERCDYLANVARKGLTIDDKPKKRVAKVSKELYDELLKEVEELRKEVSRLKEYEFTYKGLNK